MTTRGLVLLALLVLFALHHDLWWWDADDRVLGLPIGLTWHVLLCLAVAVTMALFARVEGTDDEGPS
ncbi:MAG: DUF3311 domain-containing protein [Acidobacteria bacterium]|nr:DUF3311 domain-containing protein [Acidobacteriota bacterium]NIM63220.1 DUF3311 domain-containing protein [Acidobacteriota bacterium]NIO59132.1 DUF3311 domain-containing protein [Acidobacteriota bacterium]NIQ30164.1 DUF3311 domain-containing protein [Acidobacteriota bacterium]NIQ85030.1 DUF3311 domain-containing protein [Acidobacteriota bacterium]